MSGTLMLVTELREYMDKIEAAGTELGPFIRSSLEGFVKDAYWTGHGDGIYAFRDALAEERAKDEQRRAG